MLVEFLQNPIIIGVIASILTYLYLRWDNERKYKNDPKNVKKKISLLTPGIVGAVTWYIVSNYLDQTTSKEHIVIPQTQLPQITHMPQMPYNQQPIFTPNVPATQQLGLGHTPNQLNNDSLSLESKSYHLVAKGKINVPDAGNLNNVLPDMFIEMDNFS